MSAASERRTQAPFERRLVAVGAPHQLGSYRLLECVDAPPPRPGQFYMLSTEQRWGAVSDGRPFLPRALSFLRYDEDSAKLQFLLEDVGPGTHRLCELQAGERIWLLGPLGQGFARPVDGHAAIVVGGGIGIAPLAGFVDELKANGTETTVLLGFRDAGHAKAADLIPEAQVTTDDGSVGSPGLVTDALERELTRDASQTVYACGPPQMLERVRELCTTQHTDAQLALEAPMACGFGACFGCVVQTHEGYRRVCTDGPVFDAATITPGAITAATTAAPAPVARAPAAARTGGTGRAPSSMNARPGAAVPAPAGATDANTTTR